MGRGRGTYLGIMKPFSVGKCALHSMKLLNENDSLSAVNVNANVNGMNAEHPFLPAPPPLQPID